MADTDEFWTAEEVSNYLRIPQSTIYKLAQDSVLPGFKVGKHWRFRRDTIINWIKAKEGNSLNMLMPVTPSGKEEF
ncbi:MAG: helix-turn-helix domain-containing protein [Lactococcus chungangensis]|jgi:excisionase family DNA binding protein|uniref:Helix-turn-helix domain-containing protein n=1 Tax=Pseudolactococcus chungangensis TaxID=451457 RepID=A0A847J707_9LACT|nr:helix-turn-helix domain-containing protein [Lactococcus chungangensis]